MATAKNVIEFNNITFEVKPKFKIFKFLRLLNSEPIEAISLALTDESIEKLEELEMDMKDFEQVLELIAQKIAGTNQGN